MHTHPSAQCLSATSPIADINPVPTSDHREMFRHWINMLAEEDNRLYYRDQNPEAMQWLNETVQRVDPTRIVELGTLAGLSLRTFITATLSRNVDIIAIDLSFNTLHESTKRLPIDLKRVSLLERNILEIDFSTLWTSTDRVLLYIDAHDQPQVPIMAYLLEHALPHLPPGSVVVVDDLWHSPTRLTKDTARDFLTARVLQEIDILQCFTGHFAPYHKAGSFMGFAEVIPLMHFVNAQGIALSFAPEVKSVCFAWPQEELTAQKPAPLSDTHLEGHALYNPLASHESLLEAELQAIEHYRFCRFHEAETTLQHAIDEGISTKLGQFGLAACKARQGNLRQALGHLDENLSTQNPHPASQALRQDIITFLDKEHVRIHGSESGVTIFAMPKAFSGHIGIIQRNAIISWTQMTPRPRIILFGDDPGTAELVEELNLIHQPDVPRSAHGTPLVNGLFDAAADLANKDILAYVNADIILFDDFMHSVMATRKRFTSFLMIGRRYDFVLDQLIDFTNPSWTRELRTELETTGILHAECGLDYFVHTPGFWGKIPPFALGRTVWDNWLVATPLHQDKNVVDASACVTAIHQNHDYGHIRDGLHAAYFGEEAVLNRALAEDTPKSCSGSSCDATYVLSSAGLIHRRERKAPQFDTEQFKKERKDWLEAAITRHLQADKPDLALIHLEELALKYPDDAEIMNMFTLLKQTVSQTRDSL